MSALNNLKRYEEAITCYDKALEINLLNEYAWTGRGNVLLRLKRYEEAITHYDKALEINSSLEYALRSRGLYYLMLQQYDEALKDLNHAIELEEDNDFNLYLRALAYKALNQPGKAQTDFVNAVKLAKPKYDENPQNWNNTLNLALYYLAFDDISTAKRLYELVLSQSALPGHIHMAIRGLDDFLTVFPNNKKAQTMRMLLDSK